MPVPSVLEFNQAGDLLQAWDGPGDPGDSGFLKSYPPRIQQKPSIDGVRRLGIAVI
jgi:hypothetical protein